MKILISGASGFIGSHLVKRLAEEGYSVVLIGRNSERFLDKDLGVEKIVYDGTLDSLEKGLHLHSPDGVIHLATLFLGEHQSKDISDLIQSNITFGTLLAETLSQMGGKFFLNVSTSWQNYLNSSYSPVNLYAATKQAFEDILRYYSEIDGLKILSLVLGDTYGPRDTRKKVIPLLLRAVQTGEKLEMSGGEQCLQLLHIDDVCDGFLQALRELTASAKGTNVKYSLINSEYITLKGLVESIRIATGRPLNVEFGIKPYRPRETFQPIVSQPLLKNWSPTIHLIDGLKKIWKDLENL